MALATRPKTTTHHRKRNGAHHRHSKHYLKPYWPYLPMLMIVGLGMFVNSIWSGGILGAQSNFSADSLLASTNADRTLYNLPSLSISSQLDAAAQAKANDLVTKDYWAHNSPSGETPWDFITASGYQYQSAGENLAYGFRNASDVVVAWMNSAEHRANLLDPNYQNVGFGVASSPNYQGKGPEIVVVAEYGQPTSGPAVNLAVQQPATPVSSAPEELAAQPVARVQLLTGGRAAWSLFAVSVITAVALLAFLFQHGRRFRKLIVEGETIVARHPLFDIGLVLLFTVGFLLTRTSGIIR
ncbi:MAG TPA: CAP domain-containing protein [Candidatus Saccharimonadales bacterium]|nr:CAP domain-containing protein [Candidatus Saccharimonadales bacterium]